MWDPREDQVVTRWEPCGDQVGTRWEPGGNQVRTRRKPRKTIKFENSFQRGSDVHLVKKRSVKTQSQTHYSWSHATPRFTVVPDPGQGAFLDFKDREVQDREITMEQMMHGRHDL